MKRVACLLLFFLPLVAAAQVTLDLSVFERQCVDIGFNRSTPAFGECVLELRERARRAGGISTTAQNQGDGSQDHVTCSRYGFLVGTGDYAQCRMQIDLARNQAAEHRRQYEEQLAAQQKARERAQGEAAFLLGLGMLAGQPRQPIGGGFNAMPPPQPFHRIYNLPGGRFMTCNSLGMVTNCQ
jgi:hypothetical protein